MNNQLNFRCSVMMDRDSLVDTIVVSLSKSTRATCSRYVFAAIVAFGSIMQLPAQHQVRADRLYIENKGQIGDEYGRPNADVRYLIARPGLNIQLKANSFSYDSYVVERAPVKSDSSSTMLRQRESNDDQYVRRYHRVDIELVGSNPAPRIERYQESGDYLNYYTHVTQQVHGDLGATYVRGYGRVVYRDVWPGIDLEWLIDNEGNPEYQFMVRPGGDVRRIRLRYRGAEATEMVQDAIMLDVSHGKIKESIPASYYASSKRRVDVRYRDCGFNTYGFDVPPLDLALAAVEMLVIDPLPERLWATYYGGDDADKCEDIVVSSVGELFVTGRTQSTNAIATAGAHQVGFAAPADGFVLQLTSQGQRDWATYYGGDGSDYGLGIALTSEDYVVVGGIAGSNDGIATAGAHQGVKGNGYDGLVVVFSDAGIRQWGTYYGGSGTDYARDVVVLSNDDIVLVGETGSNNAIATAGAHQEVQGGAGYDDAFIVKFNQDGVRQWGTYFGGNRGDQALSVAASTNDKIVVCGKTGSTTGIGTTGTHQPAKVNFDGDAFLARFNSDGVLLWGTYFGGDESDEAADVAVAPDGDILIVGETDSPSGIASVGSQQTAFGGALDGFVSSFDTVGVRIWSTYLGGSEYDRLMGLTVLPDSAVVVVGSTESETGISTSTTYQEALSGPEDALIAKYASSGQLVWASYYGGEGNDRAMEVGGAIAEAVVVVGESNSTQSVATASSFQATLASANQFDGFLVKMGSNPCIKPTFAVSYESSKCSGELSQIVLSTPANTSIRWRAPRLGVITSGSLTSNEIGIRWTASGIDTLQVRVSRSSDTNCFRDTSIVVTIHVTPSTNITGGSTVCEFSEQLYHVAKTAGAEYQWFVSARGTIQGASNKDTVKIRWSEAGTGNDTLRVRITMKVGGCHREGAYIVNVNDTPVPKIDGTALVCDQSIHVYRAVNKVGRAHRWRVSKGGEIIGSFSTDSAVVRWTSRDTLGGIDTLELWETIQATGCSGIRTLLVAVQPRPIPVVTGPVSPCEMSSVWYSITPTKGHRYKWRTSKRGVVVGSFDRDSVEVRWGKAGVSVDTVFIEEENPATGCRKDSLLPVVVRMMPSPRIAGADQACALTECVYRVNASRDRSYSWTVTSRGRILGSTKADSIVVLWDSGFADPDTLSVIETDVISGCQQQAIKYVRVGSKPRVQIGGDGSVCTGKVYAYEAINASANTVWILPPSAALVSGTVSSSRIMVRWNATGTYPLVLRATSTSTGCTRDTALMVEVVSGSSADVTGPSSLCLTDSKGKTYSVAAGVSGTTYAWTITPPSIGAIVSGGTTPAVIIDWQQQGTATLKVSVLSPSGCSRDSSLRISIQDSLVPTVTSATGLSACVGDTITLDAGSGYQEYAWYEGAQFVGASRYYLTTTNSTYVVRVRNGNCAGSSAPVITQFNALPSATIAENPTGTLAATTDAVQPMYQWYDASSMPWTPLAGATQATYVPSVSGTYGVEVTNVATGCRLRSLAYEITIGPPPSTPVITSLTPSVTVCSGDEATLRVRTVGGKQPYSYQWSDGNAALPSSDTLANLRLSSQVTTTVVITCVVTDADGQQDTAVMSVTVVSRPASAISENPKGTLVAAPAMATSYQWLGADTTPLPGATASTYQPNQSGTYYVVVTERSCSDTSDAYEFVAAPPERGLFVSDYDFGSVAIDSSVNAAGGHVGSVIIRNRTGAYVEVTGATTTDLSAFVVPQQWPRRMADGDTAEIAVRFTPQQQNVYSAQLNVTTTTAYTGQSTIAGTGRSSNPDERIAEVALVPTRNDVAPGDTIGVVLTMRRMSQEFDQALRYTSRVQWDYRVLEAIPVAGVAYDTSGTYAIATVTNGLRQPGQTSLQELRFRAKLAEVDTTSLRFVNANGLVWLDDQRITTAATDTVVRIRICREGGPQLIGRTMPSRIVQTRPTPARDQLDVDLEIHSACQLELLTADGRAVVRRELDLPTTSIRLDLSQLGAGVYTLVLTTRTGAQYLPIIIVP